MVGCCPASQQMRVVSCEFSSRTSSNTTAQLRGSNMCPLCHLLPWTCRCSPRSLPSTSSRSSISNSARDKPCSRRRTRSAPIARGAAASPSNPSNCDSPNHHGTWGLPLPLPSPRGSTRCRSHTR